VHLLVLLGLLWLIIGASATSTAAADMAITIQGFAFSPATITVPVGTKVTWTNQDPATHTVTSDTGVFDSKNLTTGGTFSFTFNQAGSFAYHCAIHTRMVATIVVTGAASAPTTANAPIAAGAPPASVLPKTGATQSNRGRDLIIALAVAAAVIAGGTMLRLRTGKQQKH
jgi:plastocyanin